MPYKLLITAALSIFFFTMPSLAKFKLNTPIGKITISGQDGGLVSNSKPWSTTSLKGKTTVLFYVDPDLSELTNDVSDALKREQFPKNSLHSVAIINASATWLPNFAIKSHLENKQEEFPSTVYVLDLKKVLVKKWGLEDENTVVLAISKTGKGLFKASGRLSNNQINQLINLLKKDIAQKS